MAYYLDMFSPETYETFSKSDRTLSGFRIRQLKQAQRIHPGDKLVCYLTKFSRWIGILEVASDCFVAQTPLFYPEGDPFVVRFEVRPTTWFERDHTLPIREDYIWNALSFTRDHDKASSKWTGKFRSSLGQLDEADGAFLERVIAQQSIELRPFPIDDDEFNRYLTPKVRRTGGLVTVTVPTDPDSEDDGSDEKHAVLESTRMQALLAQIGETLGCTIWLPRNDRGRVMRAWDPDQETLLDALPLSYDEATLRTIEQIDVLWLRKRAIVRAFEVEHTTSVYSGILRMADLLALQPNMDIKLHIVAPAGRRDKVFQELQRPVFSLLERGALSDLCTFISYDSLEEIASLKHLERMTDGVVEDFEEVVD
jgi:hypothetical protein